MINSFLSIFFFILLLGNKIYAQKPQKQEYKVLLEKYGEKAIFYALLGEPSIKKIIVENLNYKDFDLSYYQIGMYKYQFWGKTRRDSNKLFRKFIHGGIYDKISREQIDKIIKRGESVSTRKLATFLTVYQEYLQIKQQIAFCGNLVFEENTDFEVNIIQKYHSKTLFKSYCKAIHYWYADCTEEINGYAFNQIGITAMVNYLIKNNSKIFFFNKIKNDYCK